MFLPSKYARVFILVVEMFSLAIFQVAQRMTTGWRKQFIFQLASSQASIRPQQGQTTTPGAPLRSLFEQCVGSFTSRRIVNNEELRDETYG